MGYTAQIRLNVGGKAIHTKALTFDRKPAAQAWLTKPETDLALPGALIKPSDPMLRDVIDPCCADTLRPHGKPKDQALRTIRNAPIGEVRCSQITSQELVRFAQSIEAQPSTRGNYLPHLAAVISVAKPAWGYPLEKQAIDDARIVLGKLGVTG